MTPGGRKRMLRTRLAGITAGVVAVSIVGIGLATWFATQHHLRAQVDRDLLGQQVPVGQLVDRPSGRPTPLDPSFICAPPAGLPQLQQFLVGIQVLRADGTACAPDGVDEVATSAADRAVTSVTLRDGETRSGAPVRVALKPVGNGEVVVISRSLAPVTDTLTGLAAVLGVVCLAGLLAAGTAGLLLARRALAPMGRLTEAAERIARTEDLETPVDIAGRDEAGRLGRAFAAMTAALRDSRRRQQQLVTDAAHELRTPLTSLRTNIDLLVRSERTRRPIPAGQRAVVLDRLQAQAVEFSTLVGELVELARDSRQLGHETVPVAAVIGQAVHRATSRAPQHTISVDTTPWSVTGDASALERAVLNLLDNAIKFSPPGSEIRVRSRRGWLTVTDQGPGLPPDARAQAFERFWRAPAARALPGSGLGLAIVANTVTAHGGTARFVDPPAGDGACVRIELVPCDGAAEEDCAAAPTPPSTAAPGRSPRVRSGRAGRPPACGAAGPSGRP